MFVGYSFAGYSFVPARHTYWAGTSSVPDGTAEIQVRLGLEEKWGVLDESHDVACLVIGNYLAVVPEVIAHTNLDDCIRLCLVEGGIDILLDTRQMPVGGVVVVAEWGWDIHRTGGVRIAVCLVDSARDWVYPSSDLDGWNEEKHRPKVQVFLVVISTNQGALPGP